MAVLKKIFGFFLSRFFWTAVGIAILCALIWLYGGLVSFGEMVPLASDMARLITIGVILILWLFLMLLGQLRAARANQAFVAELAAPAMAPELAPGEENVAEITSKFQDVLSQMKRSKLGGRRFLRDMPWYVIIGPPGTGKTTALRQSGLHFPIDLSDDLKGVGGTRNCDWFFTEDAVLIDTAGRYTEQGSDPEIDAAEWRGFLNLLTRHRGRRALNGVLLTISIQELAGDEASIREHGREIRKRLNELSNTLQLKLPVYLMITKADLVPGFESFFGDMSSREREQVWGATLGTADRVDGVTVERAFTGRANLFAERAGILVIDRAAVDRINTVDEAITFATLPAFKPVVEGEMIATVKLIPFGVEGRLRDAAVAAASAVSSCGTRFSTTILAPAGASRSAVTRSVLSITFCASPGRMVETTPTRLMT